MVSFANGSTTHECPGGCGSQVGNGMLACKADWFRLPHALRAAVWRGWNDANRQGHARAVTDALEWYRANPRQAPAPRVVKPSDPRLF